MSYLVANPEDKYSRDKAHIPQVGTEYIEVDSLHVVAVLLLYE